MFATGCRLAFRFQHRIRALYRPRRCAPDREEMVVAGLCKHARLVPPPLPPLNTLHPRRLRSGGRNERRVGRVALAAVPAPPRMVLCALLRARRRVHHARIPRAPLRAGPAHVRPPPRKPISAHAQTSPRQPAVQLRVTRALREQVLRRAAPCSVRAHKDLRRAVRGRHCAAGCSPHFTLP
jgi:hypothetical protein